MRRLMSIVLLCLAGAVLAHAQSQTGDLGETVDGTVEIERGTQEKQDAWADEKAELQARYRTAQANVGYLTERRDGEAEKAAALQARVAELQRRLEESQRLQASLEDTLSAILLRLESWVERDLPFLPQERSTRLELLRQELARPDVAGADKLRRLLEALQIEAAYGGTVEVHQDQIVVGEEELFVDILRLGRISVFWRTPDGERVGEYDRAGGAWVELPGKHRRPIGLAMDMAARIRPVELVALPLGRIQP
jgi:hypothetical protein